MTFSQDERPPLRYVQVVKLGAHFIEPPHLEPIDVNEMSSPTFDNCLKKLHRPVQSPLDYQGKRYTATVHVPIDQTGYSYILIDAAGIPVGAGPCQVPMPDDAEKYLAAIGPVISRAEALTRDAATPLPAGFIPPHFCILAQEHFDIADSPVSWEAIRSLARLVILGDPGAGKTTCLRMLANDVRRDTAEGRLDAIPIYVQLRHYSDVAPNRDAILRLMRDAGGETLVANFDALCDGGRVLLLLDGLDEVIAEKRQSVFSSIRKMAETWPHVRMILTSRPAAYEWDLSDFTHVRLLPFTLPKSREWAYRALHGNPVWSRFDRLLRARPELASVVCNPLLLSATVELLEHGHSTPVPTVKFVERFVDVQLAKWDISRGVQRSADDLHAADRARPVLSLLAFEKLKVGEQAFSMADCSRWLREDLDDDDSVLRLVRMLALHTGLLTELTAGRWAFAHTLIEYYFAALHIVQSSRGAPALFRHDLSAPRWQNVWVLAFGLAQDKSRLWEAVTLPAGPEGIVRAQLVARAVREAGIVSQRFVDEACRVIVTTLGSLVRDDLVLEFSTLPARNEGASSTPLVRIKSRRPDDLVQQLLVLFTFVREGWSAEALAHLHESLARHPDNTVRSMTAIVTPDAEAEIITMESDETTETLEFEETPTVATQVLQYPSLQWQRREPSGWRRPSPGFELAPAARSGEAPKVLHRGWFPPKTKGSVTEGGDLPVGFWIEVWHAGDDPLQLAVRIPVDDPDDLRYDDLRGAKLTIRLNNASRTTVHARISKVPDRMTLSLPRDESLSTISTTARKTPHSLYGDCQIDMALEQALECSLSVVVSQLASSNQEQ